MGYPSLKLLYIVKTKGDCSLCAVKIRKAFQLSEQIREGFVKVGSQTYVVLDFRVVSGQLQCSLVFI